MTDSTEITSIRYEAPKKARGEQLCAVELDGRPWAKIDPEIVVREALAVGRKLSPERCEEIRLADETLRAKRRGAARLALRPRSRAEVRRYLTERRFSEAAIERALTELENSGTLNDEAVARRRLRGRLRTGGYGKARLRAELRSLGLEASLIERELAGALEDIDPQSECSSLARRKLSRYRPLSESKNAARLRSFLLRRGFDGETVGACLRGLMAEEKAASPASEEGGP